MCSLRKPFLNIRKAVFVLREGKCKIADKAPYFVTHVSFPIPFRRFDFNIYRESTITAKEKIFPSPLGF
jgi:hypothetical protein